MKMKLSTDTLTDGRSQITDLERGQMNIDINEAVATLVTVIDTSRDFEVMHYLMGEIGRLSSRSQRVWREMVREIGLPDRFRDTRP